MKNIDYIIHAKWIITCEEQNKISREWHTLIISQFFRPDPHYSELRKKD